MAKDDRRGSDRTSDNDDDKNEEANFEGNTSLSIYFLSSFGVHFLFHFLFYPNGVFHSGLHGINVPGSACSQYFHRILNQDYKRIS